MSNPVPQVSLVNLDYQSFGQSVFIMLALCNYLKDSIMLIFLTLFQFNFTKVQKTNKGQVDGACAFVKVWKFWM